MDREAMSHESKEEQPGFGPLVGHKVHLRDGRDGEIVEIGSCEGTGVWSVAVEQDGEYHVVAWDEETEVWEEQ